MNRYQRLMREAQDNMSLLEDEHRALGRKYETIVAENKRLRFQIYGTHKRRFEDALLGTDHHPEFGRVLRTKVDTYFDVTKWVWVANAVIPYRVQE